MYQKKKRKIGSLFGSLHDLFVAKHWSAFMTGFYSAVQYEGKFFITVKQNQDEHT